MKNKTILYLVVAVVVLIALYFLLEQGAVPEAEMKMLVEVDSSLVSEVTIYKEGETVTLERRPDSWYITNPIDYKANNSFVKTMLGKFEEMRIESEISHSEEKFADFEVDAEQGVRLTIKQGNKADEIVLGKTASGYRHTYAREEGKNTVYLIKGSYGSSFNRSAENWRNKLISDFEQEEVVAIHTPKMDLVKNTEGWQTTTPGGDSFPADEKKADQVARQLAQLRTSNFPDSTEYEMINFENPLTTIKVELASGGERTLKFWVDPGAEGRYFFKYQDDPWVYRVYNAVYDKVMSDPEELKAEAKDTEAGA
ncbi:DUF4340 domain-containing protein [bacterium]|nr:DUF4340 domain-containing protein [bacterium]